MNINALAQVGVSIFPWNKSKEETEKQEIRKFHYPQYEDKQFCF